MYLSVCPNLLLLCYCVFVSEHVCAMARSAGYRREGKTPGFATHTNTCALTHTHTQQKIQTHTVIHADANSVVAPGSTLRTDASCPAAQSTVLHTCGVSLAPYRLTQGPGGGAAPPCGSLRAVFVNVGSCSTLLARSPQPRQS